MNKWTIVVAVLTLSIGFCEAQDQPLKRKPGFTLDVKTMDELGITEGQRTKIENLRNSYRVLRGKFELGMKKLDSLGVARQDSILTASQKQQANVLRTAIALDKKPNPAYRQTLILSDPKVAEDLAVTADQLQKIKAVQRAYVNERRSADEKFNKVTADAVLEQENVLTDSQKQKAAEMRAAIMEYNKNIK